MNHLLKDVEELHLTQGYTLCDLPQGVATTTTCYLGG